MEHQKRKLKGIADLYNIEDERQKRQSSHTENLSPQNIFKQDITDKNISQALLVSADIPQENISSKNTFSIETNSAVTNSKTVEHSIEKLSHDASSQDISLQDISREHISPEKSPSQDIVNKDIPAQDIVRLDTSTQATSSRETTASIIWSSDLVDPGRGYFPIYNDITDRMIREMMLDVYEQSVLLKMYRESRGWKSDECEISHAEIVRSCNISKSQSQRTLAKLSSKGLIVNLGRSKSGPERNRFKVLPGIPVIPQKNILKEDISHKGGDVPHENKVPGQDISHANTNKNNNKELVNTHTQAGVSVGSKFSLEDCRQFAEHLQKTGQGINNPGGYATTIFRSGEFDEQIEAFLRPSDKRVDPNGCPECGGTGYYYPEGVEKGVKICKHDRLKAK